MDVQAIVVNGARRWVQRGTADMPEDARRRQVMTNVLTSLIALLTIPFIVGFALYDGRGLIWPLSLAIGVSALFQISGSLNRYNEYLGSFLNLVIWLVYAAVMSYFFSNQSGMQFCFLAGAASAIAIYGVRQNPLSLLSITTGVIAFFVVDLTLTQPAPFIDVSPSFLRTMYIGMVIVSVAVIFCMVFYAFTLVRQAEEKLQKEYDYSERLLRSMMPDEIAAQLKRAPGQIIAERHEIVTVLFADIVGFTPRASQRDANEIVRFLNDIFIRFDDLADKYQVEKIKTLGDAFMVASGIPRAQFDHAERVANLALDMLDAVQAYSQKIGETVELRIGIHSGPAVAGVIGTHKPFYDVWGDTVNTAARLETHGTNGRIQVTDTTKVLLGEKFHFSARGEMDLKGKGSVNVWYLEGRKSDRLPLEAAAE